MKFLFTLFLCSIFSVTAFSQNQGSSKNNIDIIKDYYKAFNENDPQKIATFFAGGFTNYGDGNRPSVIFKTQKEYADKMSEAFKTQKVKSFDEEYFSDNNGKVIVLANYTVTMKDNTFGTKDKSHTHYDADIYILNNEGKIISHRWVFPGWVTGVMLTQTSYNPEDKTK